MYFIRFEAGGSLCGRIVLYVRRLACWTARVWSASPRLRWRIACRPTICMELS